MSSATRVSGRLVLVDGVMPGHLVIEDDLISELIADASVDACGHLVPGYIDVHVHGWGGHSAMGGRTALDGMARALAGRGVTSFLPTAVTGSLETLARFCDSVREWMPLAPGDAAEPLGFNLEGPLLAPPGRAPIQRTCCAAPLTSMTPRWSHCSKACASSPSRPSCRAPSS